MRTRWITVFSLLIEGILMNEASLQYASKGETIHIKCLFGIVNFWQKLETQFILASCEGGLPVVNSTISNRMSVSDTCQTLTINNFTKEDVGMYHCFAIKDNKQSKHVINITLRTLTIGEANGSDIIERKEGENVELTCSMIEAKPDAFIYWRVAEKVLESNRSNYVIYRFQTKQTDDKKQFVCSANKSGVDHPLEAKVQLNLILRPGVAVISFPCPPTVKRGHTIILSCQDKSGNNETIESFVWSHDEKLLPNTSPTIEFTSVKIEDAGKYNCTAMNSAGEDSGDITITVTFSTNVENETVVFTTNNRPRTLQCKVFGVPDIYFYSKWLHYTNSNQFARTLDGQVNGTLVLPYDDSDDLTYEDSGMYICNVTNNITNEDGHLWQTGRIQVIVKGKPVLTKPRKYSYTGRVNASSSLDVFVLSSSDVSKASWFNERDNILVKKECSFSNTKTDHFGKLLNVSAYKCKYVIPNTKLKDFQNYTVKISNEFGENNFTISLMPGQEPETPTNIRLHSSANYIYVKFEPGVNGGYPQTFIIEYRKASAGPWTQVEVDNSHTDYYIKHLDQSTEYELRMYSFSKLGNSTISDNYSIYTKNAKDDVNSLGTKYIGFTLGCTLLACLVVIWWRFRKAKNNDYQRSRANGQQIQGEGLIVNHLYGSAVDLQGSSSASASRTNVYSSIDRRKEKLDNRNVTYKVATEGKRKKIRLTDRKEWNRNNESGSSKLNYIDVVFEPNPHIGTFYIHGADNRTPYADIDFSAKAEPLNSSDESDEHSSCGENKCDDFVSLEDVQQWNITED